MSEAGISRRALLGSGESLERLLTREHRLEDAYRAALERFAIALERETAAAYAATLATLRAPKLLQPLGSIMTAGAQHQVALREALGVDLLASSTARGVSTE